MEVSDKTIKFGYILSVACFISGLLIALSWSYNSRLIGVFLVLFSSVVAYKCYRKTHITGNDNFHVNKERALLGLFLIIIDICYNIASADTFKSFDYGVIIAGILIILLNVGVLRFLRLEQNVISFITYFIFITMILYGFLFSGLPFIIGNRQHNPFFDVITRLVVMIAAHILNFIKPTTFNGNLIDFNGLNVWIGDPCSGVESISVFFASIIAYMVATRTKDTKTILKYILFGIIILFLINILRILIVILIGNYFGIESMLFVHYHLGWVFFLISMIIFWNFMLNNKNLKTNDPFQK